jgi:hypothetical protein
MPCNVELALELGRGLVLIDFGGNLASFYLLFSFLETFLSSACLASCPVIECRRKDSQRDRDREIEIHTARGTRALLLERAEDSDLTVYILWTYMHLWLV